MIFSKGLSTLHTASMLFRWLLFGALLLFRVAAAGQSTDYAIAHVTVIDPGSDKPQPDMTIVIHGPTIVSVVPAKGLKPPVSTKVIDGSGKFVIPGLWDMHVHFRDTSRDLKMDVANGVLGIRNMGGLHRRSLRCAMP